MRYKERRGKNEKKKRKKTISIFFHSKLEIDQVEHGDIIIFLWEWKKKKQKKIY